VVEPSQRHAPSGIDTRRIVEIGAVIAVAVFVLSVAIYGVMVHWITPEHAALSARRAPIPPVPRLQPSARADLESYRTEKRALLSKWEWTDSSRTFARIPIERAMSLYARGAHLDSPSLPPPKDLRSKVTFEQRIGTEVPLGVIFRDERGRSVSLGNLLRGRPTVLVPGYYRCANLCDFVRAGVARAVSESQLQPGRQFNVVLLSIDPDERPADAVAAQQEDARAHGDAAVPSWHYLTGDRAAIDAVARAIGFSYLFDPRNRQYDHGAGIVILTPSGAVSQYLFGVQFAAQTLRLALVDASQGHLGTVVDRLLLLCCNYDPSTGRYSLTIGRVLQGLGTLTVLALGALLVVLHRAERRR
jgi:protein SCO1